MLSAFFTHSALHLDLGVELACSAAARVLLACPSRASTSSASSCLALLFYEASPHAEVRRLRIHVSCGSALPSSGPTSSFLSSSMRAMYMYGGGRMCFPVRECRCLPESHCIFHRSCSLVLRSLFLPGRPDVFSWPRLCTTSSPLLHSSILLISTRSSCASTAWMDTVFGVVRLAAHFEARRRFSGCMRTGLCDLASSRWNRGDWPSHPGCHCCMLSLLEKGRIGSHLDALPGRMQSLTATARSDSSGI